MIHRAVSDLAAGNWVIPDPGTGNPIPTSKTGIVAFSSAAAETNTLGAPSGAGLILGLFMKTFAVGSRVITASAGINQADQTTMTFGADEDFILLMSVPGLTNGTYLWRVVANDGVALS